jgi:hypothetical protein
MHRALRALLISVVACIGLVAGCERQQALRVLVPLDPSLYQFEQLAEVIGADTGLRLERYVPQPGEGTPLELLARGVVDFTVVENSAPYTPGVNSVLPVYRGVLHVLYRESMEARTLPEMLRGSTSLFIAANSSVAHEFVDFMARRFGIDPAKLNRVQSFEPGVTDVVVVVSSILPSTMEQGLEGYRLLSLAEIEDLGHGSKVESIPYLFPQLRPFVIPALTYPGLGNERPVVTVAVDMLLVCRAALPRDTVYALAGTLMHNRAEFSQQLPELFHTLTDRVDPLSLKFPLHPGAADYINRHDPGFIERYADAIGLLTYLLVALVTGVVAALKWIERRKKDRIDRFYAELLQIRAGLRGATPQACTAFATRIDAMEQEAWELLIAEKLAADESFRIFHALLGEVRRSVRERTDPHGTGH